MYRGYVVRYNTLLRKLRGFVIFKHIVLTFNF